MVNEVLACADEGRLVDEKRRLHEQAGQSGRPHESVVPGDRAEDQCEDDRGYRPEPEEPCVAAADDHPGGDRGTA